MTQIIRIIALFFVIAIIGLTQACSGTKPQSWSSELNLLFAAELYIGKTGIVQGYLTDDGRLWLYKEDFEINRVEHSLVIEGLSEDILRSCSDEFVTVYGRLLKAHPVIIGEIEGVVPCEISD